MAKKAIRSSEDLSTQKPAPRSTAPQASPVPIESLQLNATLLEAQKQDFTSERQALDFFISNIIQLSGRDPSEQAQMREFLELLLETDTTLREELLSGVTIAK